MVAFLELSHGASHFANNSSSFVAANITGLHVVLGMATVAMQFADIYAGLAT